MWIDYRLIDQSFTEQDTMASYIFAKYGITKQFSIEAITKERAQTDTLLDRFVRTSNETAGLGKIDP